MKKETKPQQKQHAFRVIISHSSFLKSFSWQCNTKQLMVEQSEFHQFWIK